ncbi:MAG TPA: 4-hydroxy-tetrahydrodipicolinate synthase, partial [Candidatus Methylomirabilis sp.]|nr:4-hydroxy-tetrahydrodipicolinate synthase [Candidatus Methylomirabilis sp.]
PFHLDGALDLGTLRTRIAWQLDQDIHGLLIGGVSGEYVNLSPEERRQAVHTAVKAVTGRVPVIAGILEPNTPQAMAAAKDFETLGVQALLLLTPFHNLPTPAGIFSHFRTVHDATSLPILLYNNPGRTGIDMDLALQEELAALPRVVGVKECRREMALVSEQIRRARPGFAILTGEDDLALATFVLGGAGAILTGGNILPGLFLDIFRLVQRGEVAKAVELHHQMMPLILAIYTRNHPYPLKEAMALAGMPVGPARPPLASMDEAQREEVRAALRDLGLLRS